VPLIMPDAADTKTVLAPSSAEAFKQATALHDAGKYAEAEALLREAIARDPKNGDLRNARGVMFAAMGRHRDAIWCYRDAIACNANPPSVWTNLGNALTRLKYLKSAVYCHERAIALSQSNALLYHNLGTALAEAGRHGEAVVAFNRAIEANPEYNIARWDRARSYLYLGNYRQGWVDYEARRITGQLPKRELPGVYWDGQPYPGKSLLLTVEQGFGDTLWVARYFQLVKALGGTLTIECQRELIPLMQEIGAADHFVARGDSLPAADFHCYLCSLPGLFSPDMGSIPGHLYLSPPRDRIESFPDHFTRAAGKLKIGIVWSGSTTFKKNHERAQPLIRFFQAFAVPGVQLYSLQMGPPRDQLLDLPRGGPIIDLAPFLRDFADTAAAIAKLDLIIMTDSSVAHLAGAMGKPVWLLLGYVAHWLWLLERSDSPWYPSIRLFRPRVDGDWDYVFDMASLELLNLAKL
jgi:Flp pilus assembly protein TadD